MGWVLKERGELLALNCQKRDKVEGFCTLRNMNTVEDDFHFVAICPKLVEHGRKWLGSNSLMDEKFLHVMQGKNNSKLAKSCEQYI